MGVEKLLGVSGMRVRATLFYTLPVVPLGE
jgi:hypothetical protein